MENIVKKYFFKRKFEFLIGSDNNQHIFEAFREAIEQHKIKDKVYKTISDGASNIIKAFDKDKIDDNFESFVNLMTKKLILKTMTTTKVMTWYSLMQLLINFVLNLIMSRIGSVAHLLQLAIKDVLKLDIAIDIINKVSNIINKAKNSCSLWAI